MGYVGIESVPSESIQGPISSECNLDIGLYLNWRFCSWNCYGVKDRGLRVHLGLLWTCPWCGGLTLCGTLPADAADLGSGHN